MENSTLLLGIMTVTLVWVTVHAWRIGNDRRDITLLGILGGMCGAGTALSAVL